MSVSEPVEKNDQALQASEPAVRTIPWLRITAALIAAWKPVLLRTFLATVVIALASFLLPDVYRATTTVMPDTGKGKGTGIGSLSDLASLAGVNLSGEASLAKLYPTILKSEAVLQPVILKKYLTSLQRDSVDLISVWEISYSDPARSYEAALKRLRDELEITQDTKTLVVSVSISMRDAQLSADIVNGIVRSMDEFLRTKQKSNATEQRKWIETRMKQVAIDLEKSENALREFREGNRSISGSPRLLLEQERLAREVAVNSTLSMELKKQYEIARIEEVKNVPIVNILDQGHAATRHVAPRRSVITLVSAFLLLLSNAALIVAKRIYGFSLRSVADRFHRLQEM